MDNRELDLTAFRTRLDDEKTALEAIAQSSADGAQTVELDQQRVGRISRIDALQQQEMGKESERRRKLELRRICAAVERINDGDFGDCLTCGESIAIERLDIDPAATQCIGCARKSE